MFFILTNFNTVIKLKVFEDFTWDAQHNVKKEIMQQVQIVKSKDSCQTKDTNHIHLLVRLKSMRVGETDGHIIHGYYLSGTAELQYFFP